MMGGYGRAPKVVLYAQGGFLNFFRQSLESFGAEVRTATTEGEAIAMLDGFVGVADLMLVQAPLCNLALANAVNARDVSVPGICLFFFFFSEQATVPGCWTPLL